MKKPGKLGQRRRLEIICNGVAFKTTVAQVRDNVGRLSNFNNACRAALEALEAATGNGLVSDFHGFSIQIDLLSN